MLATGGALHRQAEALRRARTAREWTQLGLVSAVESAARALGRERDLPPGGWATLLAYVSYFENGRRAVPERLRPLFREVYQATDSQLGFMSSVVPPHLKLRHYQPSWTCLLSRWLSRPCGACWPRTFEADMRMGPAFLLPAIRSQVPLPVRPPSPGCWPLVSSAPRT